MMPATFSGDYEHGCTYICTNDGATGNYTVRNAQHFCTTWSIYRTGSSANCSLKLTNETGANWTFPLYIGGEPYKGISMNTTAGKHVATIYLIMHQYNDFSQIIDRLKIKIHLPDDRIVCANDGNWSIDTVSEWNNIDEYDGTAKYKCEIPFELTEDGEIEFEYQFSWYMVGASTYIDPWPVISNVQ